MRPLAVVLSLLLVACAPQSGPDRSRPTPVATVVTSASIPRLSTAETVRLHLTGGVSVRRPVGWLVFDLLDTAQQTNELRQASARWSPEQIEAVRRKAVQAVNSKDRDPALVGYAISPSSMTAVQVRVAPTDTRSARAALVVLVASLELTAAMRADLTAAVADELTFAGRTTACSEALAGSFLMCVTVAGASAAYATVNISGAGADRQAALELVMSVRPEELSR